MANIIESNVIELPNIKSEWTIYAKIGCSWSKKAIDLIKDINDSDSNKSKTLDSKVITIYNVHNTHSVIDMMTENNLLEKYDGRKHANTFPIIYNTAVINNEKKILLIGGFTEFKDILCVPM